MSPQTTGSAKAYHELITSIEAFFDYARPAQHEKTIRSMLRAVQKNDYWKKRDPASLVEFIDVLQHLISAVYHFEKARGKAKEVAISAGMAINPVIVSGFQAFFKYQKYKKWQKQLTVLLHFALSTNSNTALGIEIDLLGTYIQLNSLVELCYQLMSENMGKLES